ncbi:sorbitol dehydrogenase-like [Ctenocephalides felis]|uniref:sorbitol dehydrogenase-like n=1 Tax=Ctenocephalides felis TaxID=7515 RepID=UPI000E6E3150|nr:sorbitol dehydrogenase-like [Ctenocephalides felis]
MSEDNLTAVLHKVEDLRLEQREIPTISDNDVLVKVDCVGICGSDVHYMTRGFIGDFVLKEPMIIGHEGSGVIAKVGKNVKNLAVDDRVAMEPAVPCRYCQFCKEGRYNLCPDIECLATPPYHGNLTRYHKHAADFCHKLPDHVTMEEGSLLEPLSVGVHACRRAEVGIASNVLILGSGPIGLVSLAAAKAMGASKVLVVDILEGRLEFAKKLGADHVLRVEKNADEREVVQQIHKIMGVKPDKAVDCMGNEFTTRISILATKTGGVAVIVGMGASEVKVPLIDALAREVDIRGVFRYCNDYPLALDLVASGKVNLKAMVTNHFALEETKEAFALAKRSEANVIKIMIHCQARDANNKAPFKA